MAILATPPSLIGQPTVDLFRKDDFEALIWNKGYSVIVEKAIQCPCKGKSGSPKTTCQNCLGLGWVFISPLETKALMTSLNSQTKYRQWSPELLGTISLSIRSSEKLSFMDKITLLNNFSRVSEVKELITEDEDRFIFLSYKAIDIIGIFYFNSNNEALIKIPSDFFNIKITNNSVVEFSSDLSLPDDFNGVLSIIYNHETSYNVVDIPHDIRSAFNYDNNGKNQEIYMPIQAIAQKSQIVLNDSTNFNGDNLIDNSSLL